VRPIGWPLVSTTRGRQKKVLHRLAQIIRFRMLMLAAGYEDGNDADTLRRDPMFKLPAIRTMSRKGSVPVRTGLAGGGSRIRTSSPACTRLLTLDHPATHP
jgi:Transposase DDE domain group 1